MWFAFNKFINIYICKILGQLWQPATRVQARPNYSISVWGSRLTMVERGGRGVEGSLVVRENADRLMRHVTAAVAGGFAASGKWQAAPRRGTARGAGVGGRGGVACAISIFCGSEL